VIPAAGFLLTGLGMILYPLNEARMKKLQGELQARQTVGGSDHTALAAAILTVEQMNL